MNSISRAFIERPVMTTRVMAAMVIFGVFGYFKLPVSALPRVDFPTISVSTQLPGANPETMATSVVAPLERAFATIPGISLMTSRSTNGGSNITMQFDLDRNIDGAALDVQSMITSTLRRLLGSTASQVVAEAPCTVTVVRAPLNSGTVEVAADSEAARADSP